MSMTFLHCIDFLALSALILVLCEQLRKIDGRRHPLVALTAVTIATLSFLCATYDIAGAPLTPFGVTADVLAAAVVAFYFAMREKAL